LMEVDQLADLTQAIEKSAERPVHSL